MTVFLQINQTYVFNWYISQHFNIFETMMNEKHSAVEFALRERVKELECLYDIASLSAKEPELERFIEGMCERTSKAWLNNEQATTEIKLGDTFYSDRPLAADTVFLSEEIIVDQEIVGHIKVHYPAARFSQKDFLIEETKLLKKIAHELSLQVERQSRIDNEESLKRIVERGDRLSILGEMTAGIAHELNTPLGSILGFSEFIIKKASEKSVQEDAKKIHRSALHAREVVKKLMFFSCEIPQHMDSVALNPLVTSALDLLGPNLKEAGIDVDFHANENYVFGRLDPVQFTQLVFNLMINAIHASKPGDTIRIAVSSDGQNVILKVEDEGHGIPKKIQDRIFEPFVSGKELGKGTGLGLSMVHGIVKSHKGRIQFSSEEGVGTTFVIAIPLTA